MRTCCKSLLIAFCVLSSLPAQAQVSGIMSITPWKAQWITVPNEAPATYGVYFFRKNISITAKPSIFKVQVSADNRYKLYVNGQLVSLGPARGDLYYWKYETVDLAPFLKVGTNTIAAMVWNESDYRPEAQISLRTGFILQADGPAADELNTNSNWKCERDSSHQPLPGGVGYPTYYVAGPGEIVNYNKSIKGWMDSEFDDSGWHQAVKIDQGNPKGVPNAFGWMLVPSSLPQMERTVQRIFSLRKATGIEVPAGFPAAKTTVTIPAHTTATLLLDQTFLTDAFFSINFSKGKKAGISISYAEALFSYRNGNRYKANRDDVDGKTFLGRKDSLIANGSVNQTFTTMTWRTYRYIQIRVTTVGEPLEINDVYGTFTGYPFKQTACLKTDNPEIKQMLDIGWRTARLCANETYMDCPYYEQLQYIGDSRIQAMVSYYNSGDDRLARNALDQMDHSRLAEGITLSRHPSFSPQVISTFSLWYIAMLHDFWMYRNDENFVKNKLEGTRAILHFFEQYQQTDGSLKHTPYWTFTDWIDSKGWDFGMSPKSINGNSATVDLQLLMAYQLAAEMEARLGMPAFAAKYSAMAFKLKMTIQRKYWNTKRGLYADTEDQELYSQHTNSLAMLTDMINGPAATALCKHIAADTSLTQATIYFKYYVHQALIKGGLGDDYLKWLDQWRKDMKAGLTTWAEISDIENVRSDCHAWGASPNIEFYRTLLGIDSQAPGFVKIKIEPHLGSLIDVRGEIPHPEGRVSASYQLLHGRWHINIALPQKTSGTLIWKSKSYLLKAGDNELVI